MSAEIVSMETPVAEDPEKYVFLLFIAGMSIASSKAVENLHSICEKYLEGRHEVNIVDIHQQPEKTVEYQIVATPTLIKSNPAPEKRLIGDLSKTEKVLTICDIAFQTQ